MHDSAQPRLTSLTLQLGLARLDVPEESPAAATPLAIAHDQAKGLMVTLRQIVHGIRPQSLTDLGLAGAVRELAGEATIPIAVHADFEQPLPEIIESTAYFVVSESLGNVARHAEATQAEVRLTQADGELIVEVEDDGHGGADPARGTGLIGLADRVAAASGRLLLARGATADHQRGEHSTNRRPDRHDRGPVLVARFRSSRVTDARTRRWNLLSRPTIRYSWNVSSRTSSTTPCATSSRAATCGSPRPLRMVGQRLSWPTPARSSRPRRSATCSNRSTA